MQIDNEAEYLKKMREAAQQTQPRQWDIGNMHWGYPYQPYGTCPSCGHCPTCGRGGHYLQPQITYTSGTNVQKGQPYVG